MSDWIHPLAASQPDMVLVSADYPQLHFHVRADLLNHDPGLAHNVHPLILPGHTLGSKDPQGREVWAVHMSPEEISSLLKIVYAHVPLLGIDIWPTSLVEFDELQGRIELLARQWYGQYERPRYLDDALADPAYWLNYAITDQCLDIIPACLASLAYIPLQNQWQPVKPAEYSTDLSNPMQLRTRWDILAAPGHQAVLKAREVCKRDLNITLNPTYILPSPGCIGSRSAAPTGDQSCLQSKFALEADLHRTDNIQYAPFFVLTGPHLFHAYGFCRMCISNIVLAIYPMRMRQWADLEALAQSL